MRNPLSLEAFADWCEKKPADEEYNWWSECNCAGAQYARSLGLSDKWAERIGFWQALDIRLCDETDILGNVTTFGALAKRLREASHA